MVGVAEEAIKKSEEWCLELCRGASPSIHIERGGYNPRVVSVAKVRGGLRKCLRSVDWKSVGGGVHRGVGSQVVASRRRRRRRGGGIGSGWVSSRRARKGPDRRFGER